MPHVADHLLLRPTLPTLPVVKSLSTSPPLNRNSVFLEQSLTAEELGARVGELINVLGSLGLCAGDLAALGARPTDVGAYLVSMLAVTALGGSLAPVRPPFNKCKRGFTNQRFLYMYWYMFV